MSRKPIEAALLSGSRARNFSGRIEELCRRLPDRPEDMEDAQREEVLRLASLCRCVRSVSVAMSCADVPELDRAQRFSDLFCELYYPVMEDGKRTVGFWSFKDNAVLAPEDVHEWVSGSKIDKKTGKSVPTLVTFAQWWRTHRPDYELYGLASDRSAWKEKLIDAGGRKSVNTLYGKSPVISAAPERYGDGKAASEALDAVLERTIAGGSDTERKRELFVLDAGCHLLALRDGGGFRCRKMFCFTSTNAGQGTGKSLLHEAVAALVPRDSVCVVPTTALAGDNLLPLYGSTVCVLTEAPSTSSERYTAEDVKAFADAGWKTAQEKYVAKRPVRDNSLKLLSSNHLSPLPVDSPVSRRVEFFEAAETDDGGSGLRELLSGIQARMRWSDDDLRVCIGWALLERASAMYADGYEPFPTARRTIDPKFLLSTPDYDYLVREGHNSAPAIDYSDYRDWRIDRGITWSPDRYRFECIVQMSRAEERWLCPLHDGSPDRDPDKATEPDEPEGAGQEHGADADMEEGMTDEGQEVSHDEISAGKPALQYKRRMATARLENGTMTMAALYAYIVGDPALAKATEAVRDGTASKKFVLRQVFPGAVFDRFSRVDNIRRFTGLVHVDFDHVSEKSDTLTAGQVRDALSELPGFVIGALSSRGDGAWAIFNAGDGITDYRTYMAAERAIFSIAEDAVCMESDRSLRRPNVGRTLGHDPDCRICDEAVCGGLPEPFGWKAPSYGVAGVKLKPYEDRPEPTAHERLANERFMEAVVRNGCEKIQLAGEGERHDTAIRAIANIAILCSERDVTPLSCWGRQLRDACLSCGLDGAETNSIMGYWRQRTGIPC